MQQTATACIHPLTPFPLTMAADTKKGCFLCGWMGGERKRGVRPTGGRGDGGEERGRVLWGLGGWLAGGKGRRNTVGVPPPPMALLCPFPPWVTQAGSAHPPPPPPARSTRCASCLLCEGAWSDEGPPLARPEGRRMKERAHAPTTDLPNPFLLCLLLLCCCVPFTRARPPCPPAPPPPRRHRRGSKHRVLGRDRVHPSTSHPPFPPLYLPTHPPHSKNQVK